MKTPLEQVRTDWKSRRGAYLTTGSVLVLIAALLAWALTLPRRPAPAPAAPGFTAEWHCDGASAKGGGFCWRDLPPASPRPSPPPAAR
jgi:hypothetical protein